MIHLDQYSFIADERIAITQQLADAGENFTLSHLWPQQIRLGYIIAAIIVL